MIKRIIDEIHRLKNDLDGYSAREALDYIESYINIISREQQSLPSNLDEAAHEFEDKALSDYDDICVTEDGEERPVLKYNFTDAFKAGAEWMAGQFQKIEGELVDWYETNGVDYCHGINTNESFEVPEGFYIKKK